MSYQSPEVKLRALAIQNAALQADLGGSNPSTFRWFNEQLVQNLIGKVALGACVTVTRPSTVRTFNQGGPIPMSQPRLQIDVYDLDSETCRSVANDVAQFMATVNLANGLTTQGPCYLLNQFQKMIPNPSSPSGPVWRQCMDFRVFNDEAT